MARTRAAWNSIIAAQLPSLSASAVAEWKLFRDMVVTAAMTLEMIFELFRADVDNYLSNKQVGSKYWYLRIAREFQDGYSLTVDNGIVKYEAIDPDAQIISNVSVREVDGEVLVFKVARTVGGVKQALTTGQLSNFQDYIAARKYPGTKTAIFSNNVDIVEYSLTAFYDPVYNLAAVQAALANACDAFRDNFRFDAVFYKSALIDTLMEVPGIVWVDVTINMSLSDGATVTNLLTYQELPAGYFNWAGSSSIVSLSPAP